ncbi:Protein YLS3, partial [Mucuna pruriens]
MEWYRYFRREKKSIGNVLDLIELKAIGKLNKVGSEKQGTKKRREKERLGKVMGSKGAMNLSLSSAMTILVLLVGFANSDITQDKTECTDKLLALASCLPYVSNSDSKAPTLDCCSGLKQVIDKSKRCLCILIKDRDDPSLGLKINVTLALNLPNSCDSPTNITQCVDLLHLAPNSPDAKVFEGFQKDLNKKNTSTPAPTGSSASAKGTNTDANKSGGGWGKRWLVAEVVCGILPFVLLAHLFLFLCAHPRLSVINFPTNGNIERDPLLLFIDN